MLVLWAEVLPPCNTAEAQQKPWTKDLVIKTPKAQGNPAPTAAQTGTASKPKVKKNPVDGLKYVWIQPGTFPMGCSPGDQECTADEKPQHQVEITKGFWMSQTEITVAGYKRYVRATGKNMPPEPAILGTPLNVGWKNEAMPITNVIWQQAHDYCTWAGGRLPTEAEWEYAARGGNPNARYGPMDEIGWDADNSGRQEIDSTRIRNEDRKNFRVHLKDNSCSMHEVGLKKPNGFGLFDTLGNLWEHVNDWYDVNYYQTSPSQDPQGPPTGQNRVLRGGSWDDFPAYLRVSYRYGHNKLTATNESVGFRCVSDKIGH